jgi:hypothetical protein
MSQKIQMELINDNRKNRLKVFQRGHSACAAALVARQPFSPQRNKTDGNPHRIETRCGIRLQRQRVNDKKNSRHDIYALIQKRIALSLLERHKRVCKQIQNRTYPAEDVDDVCVHGFTYTLPQSPKPCMDQMRCADQR